MARYTGPVCRLCRREDMKLFLKGDRCYTEKCAFERRAYPPGQHGLGRRKKNVRTMGSSCVKKQKVRRIYGILERQFRNYYKKAARMKGVTGEKLLSLLERRLDNAVFRFGFAATRSEARQLVLHRHFTVNGKSVNIPSMMLRDGDVVEVRERSRKVNSISEALSGAERRGAAGWVEVDKEKFRAVFISAPAREDLTLPIREQLVVELYSK